MQALRDWLLSRGLDETLASVVIAAAAGLAVVLLATVVHFISRSIVLRLLRRIIARSGTDWDDVLIEHRVLDRLMQLAPVLVVHLAAPVAFADYPQLIAVVEAVAVVFMVMLVLAAIAGSLDAATDIYQRFEVSRRIYIKGFVQTAKFLLYFFGAVFVFSKLVGRSPLVLLSGLGAFTAVLILVFKDAILGLVAGVQLMANNMVRAGDWIEMPKYDVDGDVLDVTLTTVKVQNWDKTIATVPTYALISESFKNWRGMSDSGGRRIKRSVMIDMRSIRFCDQEMLDRFKRIQHIRDYVERKLEEISEHNRALEVDETLLVNGRHLTNIGTFRAYLEAYLRNHPKIHKELTFLVRHLQPTPQGLPIEIYVFSNDQRWAYYEGIQADIFDHILAVIPLFDLRVFQSPTGHDINQLADAREIIARG